MSKVFTRIDPTIKPVGQDWHPAQIVAAIWMKNTSLLRLSRQHGYAREALAHAVRHPFPKGERIIAEFLGYTPQEIWPSRYHADGSPKSGRGERGLGRYKRKASRPASNNSTAGRRRNVKVAA